MTDGTLDVEIALSKRIAELEEQLEAAGCDYCNPDRDKHGTPRCPYCRMFHQGSC